MTLILGQVNLDKVKEGEVPNASLCFSSAWLGLGLARLNTKGRPIENGTFQLESEVEVCLMNHRFSATSLSFFRLSSIIYLGAIIE